MSQYSNSPSAVAGVIESVGRDLASEKDKSFEHARGTTPRAKRYSDRPMDLRLERPSVVIDAPDLHADAHPPAAQQITTRMRRLG